MEIRSGCRVEVYRNLTKDCFSVRHKGRVVGHLGNDMHMRMYDVQFVVQPAGHARVLATRNRNVHAFVRGTYRSHGLTAKGPYPRGLPKSLTTVSYNPYRASKFQAAAYSLIHGSGIKRVRRKDEPCPVYHATEVELYNGKVYIDLPYCFLS